MNNKYTAIIKQDGDWWLGWIEEISGVNCQEKSYSELLESLKITLQEALEFNREEALLNAGSDYKKELIRLPLGLPFNTENVLSFNIIEDESNYNLKKINLSLKIKLNKLLRDIRKSNNHKLLYRGDSVSNEVYSLFKGRNLGKFFLVGEKAKSNIENLDNEFSHYENNDIKEDVRKLISACNKILIKKSSQKESNISGLIDERLPDTIPNEKLEFFKLMLLAFYHNKGNDNCYKDFSPFLSLSSVFNTAVKFAVDKSKDKKSTGIVFVYILDIRDEFYYTAKQLKTDLSEYGVTWYEDTHNEYLVLGGMYPHYLIGFYELDENGTPSSFILNPWFKKALENDANSNNFAVYIDQEMLFENTSDLGWESVNLKTRNNKRLIVKVDNYQKGILQEKPMESLKFPANHAEITTHS